MKNLNFLSMAIVTMLTLLSGGLSAFAHDFEVNGIYYNYLNETAKTVEVTYKGSSSIEYSYEYTGAVTIPSSVTYSGTTYSVTEIGYWAFQYCTGLTSVTIPNSVTEIGYMAFSNCTGLKELIIEDGTKTLSLDYNEYDNDDYHDYLGEGLFYDCPIEKLYLGRNLSYNTGYEYGYSPFYNCDELTSVTIGNSVTEIGNYAFSGCDELTEVNISDLSAWCKIDFTDRSANPLYYAKKLKLNGTVITNLVIPNDISQIKKYAFSGCKGLTELTIEDGTETLSLGGNDDYEGSFYDCPIEKLYLGRNLSYYTGNGISPFYNNAKLKEVTIGNSVTEIGHYAFSGCERLTSITIPNSVVRIRYKAFEGCDGLTSIIIPNSITEIGNKAFYGCKGLTKVTIPNSVPVIGEMTFYNCTSLTSITIPNSVTEIGNSAFSGCSLRLVQTLCMTPPACGTCAFDGCYSALLMIPEGTMVDYALADEWCNFTKVQEGVTTGVEGIKTEDNALEISRYDIHGRLLSEPTKGINILKMSDGTTRTELVK